MSKNTDRLVNKYTDIIRHAILSGQSEHGHVADTVEVLLSVAEDTAAEPLVLRLCSAGWTFTGQTHKPGDSDIRLSFVTNGVAPA